MLERRLRNLNDGQERIGTQGGCHVHIDRYGLNWIKGYILDRVVPESKAEVEEVIDDVIEGFESLADFHNILVDNCEINRRNAEWVKNAPEKIGIPDKI